MDLNKSVWFFTECYEIKYTLGTTRIEAPNNKHTHGNIGQNLLARWVGVICVGVMDRATKTEIRESDIFIYCIYLIIVFLILFCLLKQYTYID